MRLNHPKTTPPPQSMEKLSSTKPVPGAKKLGGRCLISIKWRSRAGPPILQFCTHEFNQPWIEFDPELVESNTRLVESVDVEAA